MSNDYFNVSKFLKNVNDPKAPMAMSSCNGEVRKVLLDRAPEPVSRQTVAAIMIRKYKHLLVGDSKEANYVRAIGYRSEERELKLKEANEVIRIIKELRG